MKKILIAGTNSYIGDSFADYVKNTWSGEYEVSFVDMTDVEWQNYPFSGFDCVFHVAGIAHQKETAENEPLYYEVNRDLAIETAKKAKDAGISQFIFLSSMSVYGVDTGVITPETVPAPTTHYGESKLQAENRLRELENEAFRVCILRPPMVYGYQCRGNFATVLKLVQKLPVFPRIKNQRSMIYIENLCEFVLLAVSRELRGLYWPQNSSYTQTTAMAKTLADTLGKQLYLSRVLGGVVSLTKPFYQTSRKAFGSLIYRNTEIFGYSYCKVGLEESFVRSTKTL